VKKAGDLLSAIIDEDMLGKAREYSKLFSAWEQLTKKHGIAAAASHSKLSDIKRDVLLVEADHPGWIQILQTKEHLLLEDLQAAFPGLGINGIAFRLSKTPLVPAMADSTQADAQKEDPVQTKPKQAKDAKPEIITDTENNDSAQAVENKPSSQTAHKPMEAKIKNKELAEKLEKLEKSIVSKTKGE